MGPIVLDRGGGSMRDGGRETTTLPLPWNDGGGCAKEPEALCVGGYGECGGARPDRCDCEGAKDMIEVSRKCAKERLRT